jgi:hypothetical protein
VSGTGHARRSHDGFGIPDKAWKAALNDFLIRRPWLSDVESRTILGHVLEGMSDLDVAGMLIDATYHRAYNLGLFDPRSQS